jgi:predicted RNA-binding protein associated with RNAse of E/G family
VDEDKLMEGLSSNKLTNEKLAKALEKASMLSD